MIFYETLVPNVTILSILVNCNQVILMFFCKLIYNIGDKYVRICYGISELVFLLVRFLKQ